MMIYSGNKLFNVNNGAFIFMLAFDVLIFVARGVYWGAPFFVLFFIFTANEAFYFEITGEELIIKNYILPFINKAYKIIDITNIEIASTNYKATADAALKITRGDKTSMGFRSASLNLSDWQNLVNELYKLKIPTVVSASRLINEIGIPED